MRFAEGHPVRVEFTKWGGLPHWEFDGVYLGEDEHGDWLGHPAGTWLARPGKASAAEFAWVTLLPTAGAWVGTFNAPGASLAIYIDMATEPTWDGHVVRAVDLDLDVVRRRADGETALVDEDEFAEHRVALAYPYEIVVLAETTAADVLAAVRAGQSPFDGAADYWLTVLDEATKR